MSDKDYNYIAKLEKAISEKYGKEAVENPRSHWDETKEKKHREQLKEFYKRLKEKEETDKEKVGDILVSKKLLNRKTNRDCPVCKKYSFERKDDFYMNKFECCRMCYIQWVEDREERRLEGGRPDEEQD